MSQHKKERAMFVRGTTQPWYFSEAIDFCVWALQQDGLSAPPFDQHPDGCHFFDIMALLSLINCPSSA
jgi:hypothetical protein